MKRESSYIKFRRNKTQHIDVYPCTIVNDRYGGTYSGAEWLAFRLDHWAMPDEIGSDDGDEMNFWREGGPHELFTIGKGQTPDEALQDLNAQINRINIDHAQKKKLE